MELSSRTLSISKKWRPIRVGLKQTEGRGLGVGGRFLSPWVTKPSLSLSLLLLWGLAVSRVEAVVNIFIAWAWFHYLCLTRGSEGLGVVKIS